MNCKTEETKVTGNEVSIRLYTSDIWLFQGKAAVNLSNTSSFLQCDYVGYNDDKQKWAIRFFGRDDDTTFEFESEEERDQKFDELKNMLETYTYT